MNNEVEYANDIGDTHKEIKLKKRDSKKKAKFLTI